MTSSAVTTPAATAPLSDDDEPSEGCVETLALTVGESDVGEFVIGSAAVGEFVNGSTAVGEDDLSLIHI